MKNIIAVFILFFTHTLLAQQVSLSDVQNHMNSNVTVCGKVFNGVYLQSTKNSPTLLNMGGIYPNQMLTLLIWGEDLKDFPAKPEQHYANKDVCVTGMVIEYRGKPEIVLKSPDQIKLQSEVAATTSKINKVPATKAAEKPAPVAAEKTTQPGAEKTLTKNNETHDDIKLSADVKLRLMPATDAPVVFNIKKGSVVTLLYSLNGWSRISVKYATNTEAKVGKEGYIRNDLLVGETLTANSMQPTEKPAAETKPAATNKPVAKPAAPTPSPTTAAPAGKPADVKLAKDEIRLSAQAAMRAGPSVDYKVVSQVKAGTVVTVLFSSNGWSQVIIKDAADPSIAEGYISNSSLK